MDWNLKTPSWDLTDFEQETIPHIDLINGSSSSGGQGIKVDCSVDLKLGQVVDSGNELGDNFKVPNVPKMALSPSGSSKRARGTNNGTQTAMCLADGCNSDLNNCREYHRRHKVCELHSKTPQVTINGHKQRFCQQCSRFHSLEEFDEGKRSCRKRLDGITVAEGSLSQNLYHMLEAFYPVIKEQDCCNSPIRKYIQPLV